MSGQIHNILFLCTGNSARSILAEALMNRRGHERGFRAFSAGSHPRGSVHPAVLELLASRGLPIEGLRSKGWEEFATPGAPVLDFVFTVCDQAAGEVCPVWPGQPVTAHWGQPDPAAVSAPEAAVRKAFLDAFVTLQRRIELMLALPLQRLDALSLRREVDRIGQQ
ncbi:MAG: hypothetical protein RL654_2252 [Pseudomonadota bacterium]|jgi:arsenate reductase